MKLLLLIVLFLTLISCTKELNNDQIIKEFQKCKAAGMGVQVDLNGFTNQPYAVTCIPPQQKQ